MSASTGFLVCFGLTLALLGAVVATGLKAKRAAHLTCVVLAVAALGATVHYAYGLGKLYDLAGAGWITPVHLTLARVNTVALLVPVATGVRYQRPDLTGYDVVMPMPKLEMRYVPSTRRILEACDRVMAWG